MAMPVAVSQPMGGPGWGVVVVAVQVARPAGPAGPRICDAGPSRRLPGPMTVQGRRMSRRMPEPGPVVTVGRCVQGALVAKCTDLILQLKQIAITVLHSVYFYAL